MNLQDSFSAFLNAGLSFVPVNLKDKYPSMIKSWDGYKNSAPTERDVKRWASLYSDSATFGIAIICGGVSGGLEGIDFDNSRGDIEKTFYDYCAIPEIKEILTRHDLPIERTPSGGYHIIYKAANIGENKKLAKANIHIEECDSVNGDIAVLCGKEYKIKDEHITPVIIETRGEGGLIVVAPSLGYELISGSYSNIPIITDVERDLLIEYAKEFNEHIDLIERKYVSTGENTGDRPGDIYDNSPDGVDEMLAILKSNGWDYSHTSSKGISQYIRPGKSKGTGASLIYGNTFYVWTDNAAPLEQQRGYKPFDIYKLFECNDDLNKAVRDVARKMNIGKPPKQESPPPQEPDMWVFWQDTKTGYKIDFFEAKQFLEHFGFFKYRINDDKFIFVRVEDKKVEAISMDELKDFMLNYLEEIGEKSVYNMIAENPKICKSYFSLLKPIDIDFIRDTRECAHAFYRNCFLKINKDKVTICDYDKLDKFIWKKNVIDRDFKLLKSNQYYDAQAFDFSRKINASDDGRTLAYRSALGFLCHGYKAKHYCPLILFLDETAGDRPNGGTGKGISLQFVEQMVSSCVIDGKMMKTSERFVLQRVTEDNNMVAINDLDKNFDIEKIFNWITDGMPINKLYLGEIYLPFKQSPKMAGTTNYAPKGDGNSYKRRLLEFEIHPYFNADRTPYDVYKCELIDDWNEQEFLKFDNFMIENIQINLREGLIRPEYVNLPLAKLKNSCSDEFVEWATTEVRPGRFTKKSMFDSYRDSDYITNWQRQNMKQSGFTRILTTYCKYKGWDIDTRIGTSANSVLITDPLSNEEPEDHTVPFLPPNNGDLPF